MLLLKKHSVSVQRAAPSLSFPGHTLCTQGRVGVPYFLSSLARALRYRQQQWQAGGVERVRERVMLEMATSLEAPADRPWLVNKKDRRNEIWNYFAFVTDREGKPTVTLKPVYKTCHKGVQTKGGNTSNMAKHLADRHPMLYKNSKTDMLANVTEITISPTQTAPFLSSVWNNFSFQHWILSRRTVVTVTIEPLSFWTG